MINKKEYTCPSCGKVFLKKLYKKVQSVYCSQKCAYVGRSIGATKRVINTPYNCKRRQQRTCVICNKLYNYHKVTQKHCSRLCFEIGHKERMLGENNPAYKDGSSYEKRSWRGDNWETVRKEIYKRDNYTCMVCKVKCESKRNYNNPDNIIQCHHIEKYNGENNNKNNLITVCLKCHLAIHNNGNKKHNRVG